MFCKRHTSIAPKGEGERQSTTKAKSRESPIDYGRRGGFATDENDEEEFCSNVEVEEPRRRRRRTKEAAERERHYQVW